jgi:hypothetical protein
VPQLYSSAKGRGKVNGENYDKENGQSDLLYFIVLNDAGKNQDTKSTGVFMDSSAVL